MRIRVFLIASFLFWSISIAARGRQNPTKSLTQLELGVEIATTEDDGHPTALSVTVKNAGGVAVDMPILHTSCMPDGGVQIRMSWTSSDPHNQTGRGWGGGCLVTDRPSLITRIKNEWIRLRPGEFVTTTESIRDQTNDLEVGTVEHWAVYDPPQATAKEATELEEAGYIIPTEKIETEHRTFAIR